MIRLIAEIIEWIFVGLIFIAKNYTVSNTSKITLHEVKTRLKLMKTTQILNKWKIIMYLDPFWSLRMFISIIIRSPNFSHFVSSWKYKTFFLYPFMIIDFYLHTRKSGGFARITIEICQAIFACLSFNKRYYIFRINIKITN